MLPSWLNITAYLALGLGFLTTLVILFDILSGRRQKMAVMNVVWPVTSLYFGPLAVWAYWRMGERRSPGSRWGMTNGATLKLKTKLQTSQGNRLVISTLPKPKNPSGRACLSPPATVGRAAQ